MKTSLEVDQIFAALVDFQGEAPIIPRTKTAIVKPKTAPQYSYNYADLSDAIVAVKPILLKYKLAVIQGPGLTKTAAKTLTTRVVHASGQWYQTKGPLWDPGTTPQAFGSSISYMRRYYYCAALGLVTEEDDDGKLAAALYGADSKRVSPPRNRRNAGGNSAGEQRTSVDTGVTARERNKIIKALADLDPPILDKAPVLAHLNAFLERPEPLVDVTEIVPTERDFLFQQLGITA